MSSSASPQFVALLVSWDSNARQNSLVSFYRSHVAPEKGRRKQDEAEKETEQDKKEKEKAEEGPAKELQTEVKVKGGAVLVSDQQESKLRFLTLQEVKLELAGDAKLLKKLENCNLENLVPVLFQLEKERCMVGIRNEVFAEDPELCRKVRMNQMLDFVTRNHEIPFDKTLEMLGKAALGREVEAYLDFMLEPQKETDSE